MRKAGQLCKSDHLLLSSAGMPISASSKIKKVEGEQGIRKLHFSLKPKPYELSLLAEFCSRSYWVLAQL